MNATEQKHTSGPWAAGTRKGSWDWLVYSAPYPHFEICQMFHDGTEDNEIGEANAKLVAAAPELAEVVKAFIAETVDYMTLNKLGDPEKQHNVRWARAVLAKAEGSSQ